MGCSHCDGQPQFIAQEVAERLSTMLGPKRRDARRVNQHGGKGVVKYNPSSAEILCGMRAEATLVDWQSPDGEPHWVTVDVGRIAAGGGGSFPGPADASTTVSALPSIIGVIPVSSTADFPSSGTFAHKSAATGVITTGHAYTGTAAGAFTGVDPAFVGTVMVGDIIFIPLSYRSYAQVILGSPSAMSDPFFIDVARGQTFVASASFVGVTLQALPPQTDYAAGSMAAVARLGHGEARSVAPLVLTRYIDALAVNGVANVVVPPKANFLLPILSSDVNNTVQLDFLNNIGATINSVQFTNGGMIGPTAMGGEDTYSINVTNMGAVAVNYRLVFQISN